MLEIFLVDGLGRLAGGPLVLEPPQRQELALVRLGVEDSLLATPDPVLLRMFSQIPLRSTPSYG
jgi:hypothetical protein